MTAPREYDLPPLDGPQLTGSAAIISGDGKYRYALYRSFGTGAPKLVYIMLNPSTADAHQDDPTIRVCVGRAKRLGYGGIVVVNLFAWRATDPRALEMASIDGDDPIGPDNDRHIDEAVDRAPHVVCAWGAHGRLYGRGAAVRDRLHRRGVPLYYIELTKGGQPCHPLRKSYDKPLVRWV